MRMGIRTHKRKQRLECTINNLLMSEKFIIGLAALHQYLGKLYFLNKELQAEEIDWAHVQYELTRTRDSMNNIKDDDIFIESKEISRKTGNPTLSSTTCLSITLELQQLRIIRIIR